MTSLQDTTTVAPTLEDTPSSPVYMDTPSTMDMTPTTMDTIPTLDITPTTMDTIPTLDITPTTMDITPTLDITPTTMDTIPTLDITPTTMDITPTLDITPTTMDTIPTLDITPTTMDITPTLDITPTTMDTIPTLDITPTATIDTTPSTTDTPPATIDTTPTDITTGNTKETLPATLDLTLDTTVLAKDTSTTTTRDPTTKDSTDIKENTNDTKTTPSKNTIRETANQSKESQQEKTQQLTNECWDTLVALIQFHLDHGSGVHPSQDQTGWSGLEGALALLHHYWHWGESALSSDHTSPKSSSPWSSTSTTAHGSPDSTLIINPSLILAFHVLSFPWLRATLGGLIMRLFLILPSPTPTGVASSSQYGTLTSNDTQTGWAGLTHSLLIGWLPLFIAVLWGVHLLSYRMMIMSTPTPMSSVNQGSSGDHHARQTQFVLSLVIASLHRAHAFFCLIKPWLRRPRGFLLLGVSLAYLPIHFLGWFWVRYALVMLLLTWNYPLFRWIREGYAGTDITIMNTRTGCEERRPCPLAQPLSPMGGDGSPFDGIFGPVTELVVVHSPWLQQTKGAFAYPVPLGKRHYSVRASFSSSSSNSLGGGSPSTLHASGASSPRSASVYDAPPSGTSPLRHHHHHVHHQKSQSLLFNPCFHDFNPDLFIEDAGGILTPADVPMNEDDVDDVFGNRQHATRSTSSPWIIDSGREGEAIDRDDDDDTDYEELFMHHRAAPSPDIISLISNESDAEVVDICPAPLTAVLTYPDGVHVLLCQETYGDVTDHRTTCDTASPAEVIYQPEGLLIDVSGSDHASHDTAKQVNVVKLAECEFPYLNGLGADDSLPALDTDVMDDELVLASPATTLVATTFLKSVGDDLLHVGEGSQDESSLMAVSDVSFTSNSTSPNQESYDVPVASGGLQVYHRLPDSDDAFVHANSALTLVAGDEPEAEATEDGYASSMSKLQRAIQTLGQVLHTDPEQSHPNEEIEESLASLEYAISQIPDPRIAAVSLGLTPPRSGSFISVEGIVIPSSRGVSSVPANKDYGAAQPTLPNRVMQETACQTELVVTLDKMLSAMHLDHRFVSSSVVEPSLITEGGGNVGAFEEGIQALQSSIHQLSSTFSKTVVSAGEGEGEGSASLAPSEEYHALVLSLIRGLIDTSLYLSKKVLEAGGVGSLEALDKSVEDGCGTTNVKTIPLCI